MNINFGLFPPYELTTEEKKGLKGKEKGRAKKKAMAQRALKDILDWSTTADQHAA